MPSRATAAFRHSAWSGRSYAGGSKASRASTRRSSSTSCASSSPGDLLVGSTSRSCDASISGARMLARGVVIGPKKYRRLSDRPRGRRRLLFADRWDEMAQCLDERPGQTAMEPLVEFQARYPGTYSLRQLYTLQKRVRMWRQQLTKLREATRHRVQPSTPCCSDGAAGSPLDLIPTRSSASRTHAIRPCAGQREASPSRGARRNASGRARWRNAIRARLRGSSGRLASRCARSATRIKPSTDFTYCCEATARMHCKLLN